MKQKLLSPKSDLIFKLIFGDNRNIDLLTSFLQSVLDIPESEYSHLTIVDPNFRIDTIEDKLGILDVKIHTKSGTIIDVEIQILNFPQMRERIVFYTSKMITEQISKGDTYEKIKKVISIVITDYILIPENQIYHNHYQLHDKNTGSTFTDILEINTLELPKLPKESENSMLWNWMKFLKADSEEELNMIAEANPQIQKAVVVLKELSNDERTRMLEEAREKARRDEQSRINGAFEKGQEKGKEIGEEIGKNSKAVEVAKKALKKQMPMDEILDLTDLSREEIERIAKEME